MSLTVRTKNFRGLVDIEWTVPAGLSVLVGANGAGKTTFLFLVDILRQATARDGSLASAIDAYGGARRLKYFGAAEQESVMFGASLGDVAWSIEPVPMGGGLAAHAAERLTTSGGVVFARGAGSPTFEWRGRQVKSDARTLLRRLADADLEGTFAGRGLLEMLERCCIYFDYDLAQVRGGSVDSAHVALQNHGINVFSVLRNWRDWSENHERYAFVDESLRECFGFYGGLDFQKGGNVVEGWIKHRTLGESFPVSHAANGWLVALLHFTAVAGANPGEVVCIDELENALHPRALLTVLELIREYAEAVGISVVVTSQSPQVLDWFDAHPERVFVLDRRHKPGPVPLTTLRSEEWLSHFRIGRKYADGDFGVEP